MRNALAIARKELSIYFTTPLAYGVTTGMVLVSAFFFVGLLQTFVQIQEVARAYTWARMPPDYNMYKPCVDLPTGMQATIFICSRSTTATRRRKRCVTHSSLPSAVMSMQSGPPGTLMLPATLMSCVSIIETVPSTRLLRNQ